jgi:two-component system, NarL family, sensor kinase
LHSEGLIAAVSDLLSAITAAGVAATLDADSGLCLPPRVEAVLFRAAQESLRNVLEHAQAKRVRVCVHTSRERAVLEVRDDGRGIDSSPNNGEEHFGLRMLEDLARDSGGGLELDSAQGRGTTVRLEIPLE